MKLGGLFVSETSQPRRSTPAAWLILWALCSAISLGLWARPKTAALQEDEIYWIGSSYYFELAFGHGDVRSPDWQLLPARENPPMAKYVIGLGLAATGQHITSLDWLGCFYLLFESVPGAWGTGADYDKRAAVVAHMTPAFREKLRQSGQISFGPELLVPARWAMIVCTGLTSFLLFVFAQRAMGNRAGLLASQVLLMHPVVVDSYNHAMSDAVALLFSTAAAVATFSWASALMDSSTPRRRRILLTVLAGLLLALGCAAKMNSLVVVVLAGTAFAFLSLRAWLNKDRRGAAVFLLYGAAGLVIAALVFVLINPSILQDVVDGLVATVAEHRRTEVIQVKFLPGHLTSVWQRVTAVAAMTTFSQIACAALALGAVWCLRSARLGAQFIAAWWLIAWALVCAWIPFSRLRYVMPLVVPSVLLCAVFLERALTLTVSVVARMRTSSPPSPV